MTELKSFDRVAHVYDETRGLPADVETTIADAIVEDLRDVADAPRLLEVGVGTGRIAVPLAERGVSVTGVDISPKMLAVLREKRADIDVVLAESERLPLRDGSFGAALFVHILHLVLDAETTVRAAVRAVRPGGVLIYGNDDPGEGIRDDAERIIREASFEVAGVEMRGWKPYDEGGEAFGRIVREHGATSERRVAATWQSTANARRMLERLARRDFSSAWLIPDEALPAIVATVTPRLERLFGGMEVDRAYDRSFTITAARLPAAV